MKFNLINEFLIGLADVGLWQFYNIYNRYSIYRQVYDLENSFEGELDFVQLSKNILQRVIKETKASAGIIYWYDEVQNKFKLKSLYGIPAEQLNHVTQLLSKRNGIVEQVGKNQTGFLIKNYYTNPLTRSIPGVRELSKYYSSLLTLPLNTRSKTVGILILFKIRSFFCKRDLRLLNFFAPRTAIQLDHSRLYHLATDTALENAKLYVNISKLYHKAILDELTGLYNRNFLMQRLKEEIKKAWRFKQPLSIIFTDIDHFKQVNDEYGHQAGDQILSEYGGLIKKSIREYDLACRFGGEEFVILLPQTDPEKAYHLAERLREKIAAGLFGIENIKIRITASFGVSSLMDCDIDNSCKPGDEALNTYVENLIAWADDALYRAKKTGRNQVVSHQKT